MLKAGWRCSWHNPYPSSCPSSCPDTCLSLCLRLTFGHILIQLDKKSIPEFEPNIFHILTCLKQDCDLFIPVIFLNWGTYFVNWITIQESVSLHKTWTRNWNARLYNVVTYSVRIHQHKTRAASIPRLFTPSIPRLSRRPFFFWCCQKPPRDKLSLTAATVAEQGTRRVGSFLIWPPTAQPQAP